MAETTIADIYNPLLFDTAMQEAMIERNGLLASGVAVNDPQITQKLSGGGNIIEIAAWSRLTNDEPNYSNDVTGDDAPTLKRTSYKERVRAGERNKVFSAMDLAVSLTNLDDPLQATVNSIAGLWASDDNTRLSKSLDGIMKDNQANDGGDMVLDVGTDASGDPSATEIISGEAINEAVQTMGDAMSGLAAIAMHSRQFTTLKNAKLIEPLYNSNNEPTGFFQYNGYRVFVDDGLPLVVGSNRTKYTSVIFGAGSIGFGTAPVKTPSAVWREELKGNGGGQEYLASRVNNAYHVRGFDFTSASVADETATRAELALAANWDRKVDRKNAALAFLVTNA